MDIKVVGAPKNDSLVGDFCKELKVTSTTPTTTSTNSGREQTKKKLKKKTKLNCDVANDLPLAIQDRLKVSESPQQNGIELTASEPTPVNCANKTDCIKNDDIKSSTSTICNGTSKNCQKVNEEDGDNTSTRNISTSEIIDSQIKVAEQKPITEENPVLNNNSNNNNNNKDNVVITYKVYENELQMPDIMRLIQKDLSEPYSIYTYRYFIHNWPKLCFLAMHGDTCVGAIVCKLDLHREVIKRGYIAMLAVDKEYRKLKIGTNLVQNAIQVN